MDSLWMFVWTKNMTFLLLMARQMHVQMFWRPSLSQSQSGIGLFDKRMISVRCFKKHDWCYEWRIEVSLDGAASLVGSSPTIKKNFQSLCIYKHIRRWSIIQYLWWNLIKFLPTLVQLFWGVFLWTDSKCIGCVCALYTKKQFHSFKVWESGPGIPNKKLRIYPLLTLCSVWVKSTWAWSACGCEEAESWPPEWVSRAETRWGHSASVRFIYLSPLRGWLRGDFGSVDAAGRLIRNDKKIRRRVLRVTLQRWKPALEMVLIWLPRSDCGAGESFRQQRL